MNKIIPVLLILTIVLYPLNVFAEFEEKIPGSRAAALGGAFVSIADDPNGIYYNPAGLGFANFKTGFTSNRTKHFGMEELIHENVYFTPPATSGNKGFGFGYEIFGSDNYQERVLTLAYGKKITEDHAFGISFKNLQSSIVNTPKASSLSFDVGWLCKYNEKINFGLSIKNANNPVVNDSIGRTIQGGFNIKFTEKMTFILEASKKDEGSRTQQEVCFHVGEELKVSEILTLRAGYLSRPSRISLGAGINIDDWILDYSFKSHDSLDSTHGFSFGRRY